jgi:hypothetical protein
MIDPITGNERRIARITYNTNGWISPSGREGKSKSLESYEGLHGYGHEEWLFDFSKMMNRYQYGFIESVFKNLQAYEGKVFDIYLFTINQADKVKYWIGVIRNAYVLTENEIEDIRGDYNRAEWRKEREVQLSEWGLLTETAKADLNDKFHPVIRFTKDDVELFEQIPATDSYMDNLNRYQLFKWHDSITLSEALHAHFQFKSSTPHNPLNKLLRSKYEPRSKEVLQTHKEICSALYNELANEYGTSNIGCDHPTGNGTFVDMVRREGDTFTFYEIKTYNSLRKNIREALGQLLEYAYWCENRKVKQLIIVSDQAPSKEALAYLAAIRNRFKLPLYYQQMNLITNELSKLY